MYRVRPQFNKNAAVPFYMHGFILLEALPEYIAIKFSDKQVIYQLTQLLPLDKLSTSNGNNNDKQVIRTTQRLNRVCKKFSRNNEDHCVSIIMRVTLIFSKFYFLMQ